MTTILHTNGTTPGMEIPKEILRKAAESALITSFADLNVHQTSQNNGCSSSIRGKPYNSPKPKSKPCHLGQTHKVVIEIDLDKEGASSPSHSATSFFVKSIPTGSIAPRALTELAVYEHLIPELYPIKNNKKSSSPPTLARCSLTHETTSTGQPQRALLFLENLKISSFREFDPGQDFFDFDHALLAVETLARFHAQSYFLIRQLGSKAKGRMAFNKKYPFLQSEGTNVKNGNKLAQVYASFFEQIILPVVEAEHPSLAFKLRRKIQNPEALYRKMEDVLENEKYDNDDLYVVCHGDFRVEHLLYKYGAGVVVGEEPIECRMVDLKNVRLAPLGSDLVYFMFTSLSSRMRDDFEEKLIAFYCDSFEEQLKLRYEQEGSILKQEDFDIEDFHRKVEDQYRRMLEFGFYACVSALPLIYAGFSGILSNLGEVHLENGASSGGNGAGGPSVLDSLENPEKFMQLAKECLNSEGLKDSILGVVKRLVKARIF